jgi:hypothetical protein
MLDAAMNEFALNARWEYPPAQSCGAMCARGRRSGRIDRAFWKMISTPEPDGQPADWDDTGNALWCGIINPGLRGRNRTQESCLTCVKIGRLREAKNECSAETWSPQAYGSTVFSD